jgi:hypothetical protein
LTAPVATFIGQQSWLIELAGARVLVDPVLTKSFGNCAALRFEIYPGRRVDLDRLPDVDAVVVTNEHLDHLHLPSLRMLATRAPIVMPLLMPTVSVAALRELIDAQVVLLAPGENYVIGDAELCFLGGAETAPVWESRVHSVWLAEHGQNIGGVLIQSDTELGAGAAALTPELLIVTHNAQIPPSRHLGAFGNMLPFEPDHRDNTTGLQILRQLLIDNTSRVAGCRFILFSGGGYIQNPPKHGPFLWGDYNELAKVANSLSIDAAVIGLVPGQRFTAGGQLQRDNVDWITQLELPNTLQKSDNDADEFDLSIDIESLFNPTVDPDDAALIDHELQIMAPHLMMSPLGRSLIDVNDYLGNCVGPHRFAIHLRGRDCDRVIALNFNTARFEDTDATLRDALFEIPCGIDVWAADLVAVLRGRIHIWELAVSRTRQWYVGDALNSPVGFLYGYLSEQLRPDLAARLYRYSATCQAE